MQLALAEIPLLRFEGGAPLMSSSHLFTACPPSESVGAAACSASHISLDAVMGYSLIVCPTCPFCVSSRVSVDVATGGALPISLDAVAGVLLVCLPLMPSLPVSLQVLCERRLYAAGPARLGL